MREHVEAPTKTVVINWVEESHHCATVRVPHDFDPEQCDLPNALAQLGDYGLEFVERAVVDVRAAEPDPAAVFFDPPRYRNEGASA